MKQKFIFLLIFIFPSILFCQVYESMLKPEGIIYPRMNTAQRDALTAVEGQCIYNMDTDKVDCYNGATWDIPTTPTTNTGTNSPNEFPAIYITNTFSNPYVFDMLGNQSNLANGERRAIEIIDGRIFILTNLNGDIEEYDVDGNLLNTINPDAAATYYLDFVALPEDKFALLDNNNDNVYIIDDAGMVLSTVSIPNSSSTLQNMKGVVVNNLLFVSENGNDEIFYVNLDDYSTGIFRDLSFLSGWIGDIDFANNKFYLCQATKILSFTTAGVPETIVTLPTSNNTAIAVVGHVAYVNSNFGETIYEIDLINKTYSTFKTGLNNRPNDLEVFRKGSSTNSFAPPPNSSAQNMTQNQNELLEYNKTITDENLELQEEIEILKDDMNEIKDLIKQFHSDEEKVSSQTIQIDGARLGQNTPNPFNQITTIPYFIPENSRDAFLKVHSQNGTLIKTIKIQSFGEGEIQLKMNGFSSGIYHYSLEVNGNMIGTKKMTVTY